MFRLFIRQNITSVAIVLFVILFAVIQISKPAIIYNKDGSLRQFGLASRKKTVLPIWLITIFLAILCYLFILYYLTLPKFT
jgi:sterol desaturase/sphingolipid hydroxylase (fatty acid hydroxylase superfamily)|tara:strand:+ start:101 stop:343 length:243 start_codon:yes stop_codon:yes gene_type:complete